MRPNTLAQVAQQIREGKTTDAAFKEFVDSFLAMTRSEKIAGIREEPAGVSPETDALLAACAEHMAHQHVGQAAPGWTTKAERFLKDPVFLPPTRDPGLREYMTFASPSAFKRRNIMTGPTPFAGRGAPSSAG